MQVAEHFFLNVPSHFIEKYRKKDTPPFSPKRFDGPP